MQAPAPQEPTIDLSPSPGDDVKTTHLLQVRMWVGIRPGSDGLFAFALIHELLRMDRIDLDDRVCYANAH